MAWKAWFDDGTTFDSAQGAITDMPNKGIVVVAFSGTPGNPGGVYKDQDWYVYGPSIGFHPVSLQTLLRQITTYAGQISLVRQGGLVNDATYNQIVTAANTYAGL